ncbi:hypothetical protein DFQ26_005712 [Actinomortierella ambigua]|nr:hypothetical protein DFQ26_005712 [Actinomortierella ambigua]
MPMLSTMVSFTRPIFVALVCLVAFVSAEENPKAATQQLDQSVNHHAIISADAIMPAAFRTACYTCSYPCDFGYCCDGAQCCYIGGVGCRCCV